MCRCKNNILNNKTINFQGETEEVKTSSANIEPQAAPFTETEPIPPKPAAPVKEKTKDNSSDDDEDDDDGEILEESPCGRWLKRREQVTKIH
jgi:hypothetical protein